MALLLHLQCLLSLRFLTASTNPNPKSQPQPYQVFDRFIDDNELMLPALSATSDAQIRSMFEKAALPSDVTAELRRYLTTQDKPVAVRSSSLFEDAFLQPFAGIYDTIMMPNNTAASLDERVDELGWAVRMVYASTYSQQAKR